MVTKKTNLFLLKFTTVIYIWLTSLAIIFLKLFGIAEDKVKFSHAPIRIKFVSWDIVGERFTYYLLGGLFLVLIIYVVIYKSYSKSETPYLLNKMDEDKTKNEKIYLKKKLRKYYSHIVKFAFIIATFFSLIFTLFCLMYAKNHSVSIGFADENYQLLKVDFLIDILPLTFICFGMFFWSILILAYSSDPKDYQNINTESSIN